MAKTRELKTKNQMIAELFERDELLKAKAEIEKAHADILAEIEAIDKRVKDIEEDAKLFSGKRPTKIGSHFIDFYPKMIWSEALLKSNYPDIKVEEYKAESWTYKGITTV